jgi:ubiquinone/menaquinone biosynthesis C-methylase UbiE
MGRQLGNPDGIAGALVGRMMRFANQRPTRIVVDALDLKHDDVVLDMGYGPGHTVEIMARRAGCIYGIDRSETMRQQACRRNRDAIAHGRVALTTGLFDSLPYPDGFFDKVVASNVLYFWHNEQAVLAEVRRVLRPGGRLCIYVTDAATMARWKFADARTHRHFTAQDLTAILVGAGFAPDDISVTPVAVTPNIMGLVALARRATNGAALAR